MEMQLLFLLNYDLRFDESEVCRLFAPFMAFEPSFSHLPVSVPVKDPAAAATRASALTRVTKASKDRTEAQQQMQSNLTGPHLVVPAVHCTDDDDKARTKVPQYPARAHVHVSVAPAPISSAVRGVTRQLSAAHIRRSTAISRSSAMYASLSTDSSSSNPSSTASSSSDLVSLMDDNGSTSSSSGWMSSGSDTDDSGVQNHNHKHFNDNVGIVDPSTSFSNLGDSLSVIKIDDDTVHLAGPGTMKKPFALRPSLPSFRGTQSHIQSSSSSANLKIYESFSDDVTPTRPRVRKPSDTSSVRTVTNYSSPVASLSSMRKAHGLTLNARSAAGLSNTLSEKTSIVSLASCRKVTRIPSSSTMPSIAPSTASSGFLSHSEHSGGGAGRPRFGTVVHRASSGINSTKSSHLTTSRFRLNLAQPPSVLSAHNSASSSSSANPSANTSTSSSASSSTKVGVTSIFSRMWGAAAANLKGVGGGQIQNTSDPEAETRPLNGEESISLLEV